VTTLGMALAGGTSYVIARAQTQDAVYGQLRQETEEFRTNVQVATEDGSGVPIGSLDDLLSYTIKSTYPNEDEAVLGIIDGKLRKVPGSDTHAHQENVETDDEFIAVASEVQPGESPGVYRISTEKNPDLAYVSVPVQVEGSDELGHYVTAVDMTTAFESINHAYLVYAYVAALTLIVVGAITWLLTSRLLRPLRSLRTTAQRITDADLTDRIPEDQLTSRDEVADLGRTMNEMLDRLATSFETQRRYLDDVGHELRTPITIVQGHQELMDPDDPDDVQETRDLTLDELQRMQRLVDDLLLLAKSRRPDFVQTAPTPVDEVLVSVLEKVTPLGTRRWTIEESTAEQVPMDRQRVTQALVQLVANALRFTHPGDVIALGARIRSRSLRVWVRDEGTGISPQDQETIFSRERQGADGGNGGGMGLGLAIVTAIAEAHGGRVELDSELGAGSTFTVLLPLDRKER
jgi:signal transduction histidine kinase